MSRPAADENTTREGRPLRAGPSSYIIRHRWATSVLYATCEVKSLQWQRLQGLVQDATVNVKVLQLPPAFQHVLTASTVTYDQAEHCPIRRRTSLD